jgi:hypothetical protein
MTKTAPGMGAVFVFWDGNFGGGLADRAGARYIVRLRWTYLVWCRLRCDVWVGSAVCGRARLRRMVAGYGGFGI